MNSLPYTSCYSDQCAEQAVYSQLWYFREYLFIFYCRPCNVITFCCRNRCHCISLFFAFQPSCHFNPQTFDMGSKMSFSRGSSDQNTISDLTSVTPHPRSSIHAPSDCKQVAREIKHPKGYSMNLLLLKREGSCVCVGPLGI